jgi:hypothetical protein
VLDLVSSQTWNDLRELLFDFRNETSWDATAILGRCIVHHKLCNGCHMVAFLLASDAALTTTLTTRLSQCRVLHLILSFAFA